MKEVSLALNRVTILVKTGKRETLEQTHTWEIVAN